MPAPAAESARWWQVAWVFVGLGVVLRVWGLGGQDLTFDEAFTASAARKPVGELLEFLRYNDTHPPLDYLIRKPFTSSASDLVVRLPSAALSVGALLVLVHWMRSKGPFGAYTVIAASVMPFLIGHGREARMYPAVMLLGVVAACLAERWLDRPSTRLALAIGGTGMLAMLSHAAAIPAVAMLGLLPGLRQDRDSWVLRGSLMAAFAAWVVLWGGPFLDQSGAATDPGYWLPLNSPAWFETVSAALVNPRSALTHVSFAALVLAVTCLLARRDAVAWVGALTFVLPLAALAVIGFELRLFIPRSFAFGSWAVAAGIGAGIDWLRRTTGARGGVVGVTLALVLLVPPSVDLVRFGREEKVEFDVLRRRLEPGDQVSVGPAWFRPLLQWEFVAKRGFTVVGERAGRFVIIDASASPSGREHLLDHLELPLGASVDGTPCGPTFAGSSWLLRCIERR